MKLSAFHFEVPQDLIAKEPLPERDDSRLMVVNRAEETIDHYSFRDILKFLGPEDTLVLNDSKQLPCYLHGRKERTKSSIGVLLLSELDKHLHLWDVYIEPARKIRTGNKVHFRNGLIGSVIDNTTSRGRTLKFAFDGNSEMLHQVLRQIGEPFIPKMLGREVDMIDRIRYQNVYASEPRAVVPPFAGFHFTPFVLKSLELNDVSIVPLTLHMSVDTFKPVEAENFAKYKIHSEFYRIPESSATVINNAIEKKKKICAVGTSTLKVLESSVSHKENVLPGEGWAHKLIYPPYSPLITSALLTNFHLPRSIDFINTLAFAGPELAMEAYEVAIEEKYRFFVYGDAMLII